MVFDDRFLIGEAPARGSDLSNVSPLSVLHSHRAGLNSTALDLARFAHAVASGKILARATLDSMWTAVSLANGTTFRMEKLSESRIFRGIDPDALCDVIPGLYIGA